MGDYLDKDEDLEGDMILKIPVSLFFLIMLHVLIFKVQYFVTIPNVKLDFRKLCMICIFYEKKIQNHEIQILMEFFGHVETSGGQNFTTY